MPHGGVQCKTLPLKQMMHIAWRWLVSMSADPIYFGSLSSLLHDSLLDDPAAYRKEVKELLSNILSWSEFMCPERCRFDTPNVSQRIQII